LNIKVTKPVTLFQLLRDEFKESSGSSIKKMILQGSITVNNSVITRPTFEVKIKDKVEYTKIKGSSTRIMAPFPVLFEDDHLLVAEKPAGLLTYGERGSGGTSLYMQLLDYVKQNTNGAGKLFVVHRIDREVSGLIVFAKSEQVQTTLKENWPETRKKYTALVEGCPKKDKDTIRTFLMEGDDMKVFSVKEGGKLAITNYEIREKRGDYTLLDIQLETGRKNQIRVHMSEIGCPIVGDYRYGADAGIKRRIRLHAWYLSFRHPITMKNHEFRSLLPPGFLELGDQDEKYK